MPHTYSQAERDRIVDHVCDQLATGRALSRILREDADMPGITAFWNWQRDDPSVAEKVVRARETGVETLLDETVQISDERNGDAYLDYVDGQPVAKIDGDTVQRAKLRVRTRFEYAQMIAPRKYGPKLDVTSGGEKLPAPAAPVLLDARIQSLVRIAQRRLGEGGPLIELSAEPSIEDLMG